MMRTPLFFLFFLCSFPAVYAQSGSLKEYTVLALERHPDLKAARLHAESLKARAAVAGLPDDPMLMVGVMNLPTSFSFTEDMMTMTEVGVSQMFMVPGKYRLMEQAVSQEYAVALRELQAREVQISSDIRMMYYDIYAMDRAIVEMVNAIELVKHYADISAARLAAGEGIQQDLLKAQVELSRMAAELLTMRSERRSMATRFNALLYRDVRDSVPVAPELRPVAFSRSFEELMQAAENSPMLQTMQTMAQRDRTMIDMARSEKIPDFEVRLSYGYRAAREPVQGSLHSSEPVAPGAKARDMVSFSVGMTLPFLWGRSSRKEEEAATMLAGTEAQIAGTRNDLARMIQELLIDIHKNAELMKLYKEILLPQASQALQAGMSAYQVGKVDFMTLMDDCMDLYTYHIEYEQSFAEYHKKLAELEMLTGTTFL